MGKLTGVSVAGIPEDIQELTAGTGHASLNDVVGPEDHLPWLLIPGQMESWQHYECVLPDPTRGFEIVAPTLDDKAGQRGYPPCELLAWVDAGHGGWPASIRALADANESRQAGRGKQLDTRDLLRITIALDYYHAVENEAAASGAQPVRPLAP